MPPMRTFTPMMRSRLASIFATQRSHRQHVAQRRLADRHVLVEAEDAGKRDVEEREDAVGRMGHHIVAEAVIIARAGAARIDQRRRAGRAPRDEARVDAERGRLVVDMGMDVDEPRRDDQRPRRSRPARPRPPARAPTAAIVPALDGDVGDRRRCRCARRARGRPCSTRS